MVKPGYISPVHNDDLTTDMNSETTSKLCKSLTTDARISFPLVFHKTNDNIYKQNGKSVAIISRRFYFLFDINEETAQQITNENLKILSNRHCLFIVCKNLT